ncbi:arylesterase [Roseibium litorale]|uniref:Arylesterase n=1 Tax=Roseibium litorale TaxID=2803841 RepID=A0ABR9CMN4_9HYPH|nr:arylesterase [Roseibium litorale]MBD8892130.1 arylesterase [Roseibium litorale]
MRLKLYQLVAALASFLLLSLPAVADPLKLVVLGDSLSAGYLLGAGEGFPEQLQQALKEKGYDVEVVNAGVSGDTSSGGLSRLDWSVGPDADAVIVELGANDMLRAIPPEKTRENIGTIVSRLKERGVAVLIAGMMAQRNLGDDYAEAFDRIFPEVAKAHDALLYPFFLEGIALDPSLNLADGMHPNAEGVSVMVRNMLPIVETLLKQASAS